MRDKAKARGKPSAGCNPKSARLRRNPRGQGLFGILSANTPDLMREKLIGVRSKPAVHQIFRGLKWTIA
jgi:hypothetical protein